VLLFCVVAVLPVFDTVEPAGDVVSAPCIVLFPETGMYAGTFAVVPVTGTAWHPPRVVLVPIVGSDPSGHCNVTLVTPTGLVVWTVFGLVNPVDALWLDPTVGAVVNCALM
jgi:hypothetical protein